jgi:hypothetical protein
MVFSPPCTVQNIEQDKAVASLLIDSCLTTLVSVMKNSDAIERESQRLDDVRALNGEGRLRTFEGPLTTVRWFDELVARELAEVFVAITGQKPTMGGYKRLSNKSGRAGEPAREIKSPFTVFALYLVRIAKIKRLGSGQFTVTVLRKAMAPYWQSKRQFDGEEQEELAGSAVLDLHPQTPKRRGRPPKAQNRDELRDETPMPLDICSAAELDAIDWIEVDVD